MKRQEMRRGKRRLNKKEGTYNGYIDCIAVMEVGKVDGNFIIIIIINNTDIKMYLD